MSTTVAQGRRFEFEPYNGVTPRGVRGGQDLGPEASSERPWERIVVLEESRVRVWQSADHGMPVVMLHAAGGSKEVFRHQFDGPLAQSCRLIAIDLPSDPRTHHPLSADIQAAQTAAVLDQLGVIEAVFLGWGRGAEVALSPALAEVRSLGLVVTGVDLEGLGPRLERDNRSGLPILSIHGSEDPVLHARDMKREADWLWLRHTHIIPQAGHAPFIEAPQLFNHLLARFLDEVKLGDARVEARQFA